MFGSPSNSGERFCQSVLGDYGAWDTFQLDEFVLHVQYDLNETSIEKVTLMTNDVAASLEGIDT